MMPISPVRAKRCAIYTRKSVDAPMGQEVTSLQSQRAICASYIASQQHKGWVETSKPYDDAGRTGANLNRPALQELMADIEAGLVDIVVVYKLDRITRTLLDFVRLIDFFDRFGVAFVAITQNFDTSDSMGRLIRNILLTFAQFEREIASDRICDKKMIMKQRGFWTGGDPPLGYELKKGRLVVNKVEAPAVRCVFETYVEEKRISAAHKRLIAEGHRRRIWRSKSGAKKGGGPISLTSLHHVLANPAYIGELTYRGERLAGSHQPIIDRALWDKAQAVLAERQQFKPRQPQHILTSLLVDAFGRPMHAHQVNGGNANGRYYSSSFAAWAERQRIRPMRVRAEALEQLILETLKRLLFDRTMLRPVLLRSGFHGVQLDDLSRDASAAAVRIDRLSLAQLSGAMKYLVQRIEIGSDTVFLTLRVDSIAGFITWDGVGLLGLSNLDLSRAPRLHTEEIPAVMTRERRKSWLPLDPCADQSPPNSRLIALLGEARVAQELVYQNRKIAVADLAHARGYKPALFSRLIRLNYLAPDIVAAIMDGMQPDSLTRRQLMACDLPIDWALQRRLLGFPARQKNWRRDTRRQLTRSAVSADSH